MSGPTLGIFAKEPRPGRVKTRLSRALSPQRAADLYTAMLEDTVTSATRMGGTRTVVFFDGEPPSTYLDAELLASVETRPQGPGDLGERLGEAAGAASQRGWLPLLFLGSDSPDLPQALVREALEALEASDVVLGPTEDGGVWCIGLRAPIEGFFDGLPWSSSRTGAALQERARSTGLGCTVVRGWRDVDEADDLLALRRRLREGASRAPRTERWLAAHESLVSACAEPKQADLHRGRE